MPMNPKEIKEWVKGARDKELADMWEILNWFGDRPGEFVTQQKKKQIVEEEIKERDIKSNDSIKLIGNQYSFSF